MRLKTFVAPCVILLCISSMIFLTSRQLPPTRLLQSSILIIPPQPDLYVHGWETEHELVFDSTADIKTVWDTNEKGKKSWVDYEMAKKHHQYLPTQHQASWNWFQIPYALKVTMRRNLKETLAGKATVTECVTPITGNKRAWRVEYWNALPLMDWLGQWLPAYKTTARPVVQIWITRMDGSKPYLLGIKEGRQPWGGMEPPGPDGIIHHALIYDLNWSPDGTQLGYLYQDAYYAIPVTN